MGTSLARPVRASWLAERLGLRLVGSDLEVHTVCSLRSLARNGVTFAKDQTLISEAGPALVLGSPDHARGLITVLASEHPRLDFARLLRLLLDESAFVPAASPRIHPTATIGRNVVLGMGVQIGERTVVGHNVVIGDEVRIGRFSIIKSGAVIGEDGFGFERDEAGVPIRIPHLGSVVIGDHVEIGSLTTVCRGTLDDTVIEDFAKIDDHVHVAHNCRIATKALVIACAELSGGTVVGESAWVAPNASVLEKVTIGDRATIGLERCLDSFFDGLRVIP